MTLHIKSMESTISAARNFGREIYEKIKSVLNENETIECEPLIGRKFRPDILLPKGCRKLDLPNNTIIEIYYHFGNDTLLRFASEYKEAIDTKEYGNLLIICKDSYVSLFMRDNSIQGRAIIWTEKELSSKIEKAGIDLTKIVQDSNDTSLNVLENVKKNVEQTKISLFIGAGVSMDAKLPSWEELLKALLIQNDNMPFKYINDANANAISGSLANSSIVMGRYIIEGYRDALKRKYNSQSDNWIDDNTKAIVSRKIREVLYRNVNNSTNSELVKAIAQVAKSENVEKIISYNYDDLIETEIEAQKKGKDKKQFIPVYNETMDLSVGTVPIYHVHGFIPRDNESPGVPVLSEMEYHKLYSRMHHWANVVQLNALYTTTCFFIGFSMTDPNQRRLLDLARNIDLGSINAGKAQHYIFLHRQKLEGEAVKVVNDEHCIEIQNMMFELGLNVIWFDEFKELPQYILKIFGQNPDLAS